MNNAANHMHGAGVGAGTVAPPASSTSAYVLSGGGDGGDGSHIMHMTFFWGKNAEILFSNWPGYGDNNIGMYILALFVVFALAFVLEWLSHSNYVKDSANRVVAGFIETLLYGIRIGLAYLVMLAVMSFNGGIFLAAIGGHVLGFLVFGSRVFKKSTSLLAYAKASDLPPAMACNC